MTGISDQQALAVDMLVSGMRQQDIARDLGVAPETISRWKADFLFAAALSDARKELREHAHDALCGLVDQAVGVVSDAMGGRVPALRLKAAELVLRAIAKN